MSRARLVPWLLGAALLAAVVVAALHVSEARAFVQLARAARPAWLAAALALQGATYVAQGGIWRGIGRASGHRLSRGTAFELSLAKLFADQALPSAGLSSSVLIARALRERRLPAPAVNATVLVNIASYHLAYVIALVAALVIAGGRGETGSVVGTVAALFLLFSIGLSAGILTFAGRRHDRIARAVRRFKAGRVLLRFLAGADVHLLRDPRVLAAAVALQLVIVGCDAATMWTLIRALGTTAAAGGVFASFMVASLFRTMGILPGGLGAFEATSVVALHVAGVAVPVALAATLLFRGLSFWLPMLPGYECSRRAVAPRHLGRLAAGVLLAAAVAGASLHARSATTPPAPGWRASILVYHRFAPTVRDSMTVRTTTFEWQLRYLRDHHAAVVPLRTLIAALRGEGPAPPPGAVVLTADDGHASVWTEMWPRLRASHAPVTLFIYPSAISNASYAMTWDELRTLAASGDVDVESHTYWHPNFADEQRRLSPDAYRVFAENQLCESRTTLDERLGIDVQMLAWPFGVYTPDLLPLARTCGYLAGFTLERRFVTPGQNLMTLPRFLVTDQAVGAAFAAMLPDGAR